MTDVDSSSGGYLTPADAPAPAEDADLDAIFQRHVAAITGLPGALVRPRWQPGNPKQPEPSVDWCAIGVVVSKPDANPAITHESLGDGSDHLQRHESIGLASTFYGPRAKAYAGRLRDGVMIPQNREQLAAYEIDIVECGDILTVPELVNQQWVRRQDMTLRFNRKISRVYPVRNIAAADIHLFDDTHVDKLIHVPPTT